MSRTTLNQSQFYLFLKEDKLTGAQFGTNYKVTIDSDIIDWESRTIINITFEELIVVKNLDIRSGLIFINCNFKKGIVFHNASLKNFDTTQNDFNASIVISECTGIFIKTEAGCELDRPIKIGKNSEFEKIIINHTEVLNGGLNIAETNIKEQLDIAQSKLEVRVSNSTIDGVIRMETVTGDVSIIKSVVSKFAKFWNIECPFSFTLNHNTFEDEFEVKASRIKGFYSHGDTFYRKGKLENRDDSDNGIVSNLKAIYITEGNFIEGFEFDGMGKELQKLNLPLSPNFKGVLRFIGWKIYETNISGINTSLKLVFKRVQFKRIIFIDFANSGDITFERCSAENERFLDTEDPDSSIIASDSDFGITRFTEFDFNSFDFLSFDNVSFNGIVATNVNWFSEDKVRIESSALSRSLHHRRVREIYRQIKYSLQSQGNQIDSLGFKAREMRAYRNELLSSNIEYKQEKKSKLPIVASKYTNSDRTIMTVNKLNDYGLNWWKPLWIVFFITLGFYIIMLPIFSSKIAYIPPTSVDDFFNTLNEFWHNGNVFWQMFNPARRVSLVYGENQNGWLYLLDFLHRVILGILIFQIIKAFRRLADK